MKSIYNVVLALVIGIMLQSCASKMTFGTSTVAPAASGTINMKKDKNKNYVLKVNVRNLADPKNLTPSKKTYLVWAESKDNTVKKLGQVAPSGRSLQASLSATTTEQPGDIFITAEDNVDITYPDGLIVLTTKK